MTDIRTNPAYAAMAQTVADRITNEEIDQVFEIAMRVGQELFWAAWQTAERHAPVSVPAVTALIIDAAWALAAAHAEDHLVPGETAGIVVGVEERLTSSADGIRRYFYPRWRRMLAEQGGPKPT